MSRDHDNNLDNWRNKDKQLYLVFLRRIVLENLQLTFEELHEKHSEDWVFYNALRFVTTTKKALCEALKIPVEAGCRYKRDLEKRGLLVQSVEEKICPYTKHPAHLLSTNPDEFDALLMSNQLNLF